MPTKASKVVICPVLPKQVGKIMKIQEGGDTFHFMVRGNGHDRYKTPGGKVIIFASLAMEEDGEGDSRRTVPVGVVEHDAAPVDIRDEAVESAEPA